MTFLRYLILCIGVSLLFSCSEHSETSLYAPSTAVDENTYASKESCKQCHASEVADWQTSHHAKAMQVANPQTVLANFNTTFSADQVLYQFTQTDSTFQVTITESGEAPNTYPITHTFGITPLQQYLLAFPNGKLQVLRASWDTEKNQWFHQYSGDEIPASSVIHFSQQGQNWNSMCSSCHSTQVEKNYHAPIDSFHTTYSDLTVGCQSCHGPMQGHVLYEKGDLITAPKKSKTHQASARAQTNMCGTCHARRTMLSDQSLTDSVFLNSYIAQTVNTNFYEADGQIKEEDFVYGSFISSKMHKNHVTCTNCHSPHTGKLKKEGNNLCLQCHESTYNTTSHTHHDLTSAGGQCINCHMDGKTYMGNDYRRDHSFRVPKPHQSVKYGTSNSCVSCHKEKSNQWASKHVTQWFGAPDTNHYSDYLIKTSLLNNESIHYAELLLSDTATPAIIQATAVDYIGDLNVLDGLKLIERATKHPAVLVRLQAISELVNYPTQIKLAYAPSTLKATTKAERIMGYRLVIGLENQLSLNAKKAYTTVENEYTQYLTGISDFANGQILWGEFYGAKNQPELAKKHFKLALKIDSLQPSAFSNLIIINSQQQKSEAAKQWINQALHFFPEYAEFHYYDGLLYAEQGNTTAQLEALSKAYALNPNHPKYVYNYLISEFTYGDPIKAKRLIQQAVISFKGNAKIEQLKSYL